MDIAKPKDDQSGRMDWQNKLTMKLNIRDISQIILGVRHNQGKADLIHRIQKDDGTTPTTSLKIEPGTEGTFRWSVFKNIGDNTQNASIFLDQNDMYLVFNILESAIPIILGWTE